MTIQWGPDLYGDPCRECGYDWSIMPEDALALIAAIPARYAALVRGSDGSQRHPDLGWSAGTYVCHVADNLRIWAERLAGCALGGERNVAGYDENLLARARAYERVPIAGALWSLQHAADAWVEAVDLARREQAVLVHAERGEQTALDVVRNNTHDAYHHEWDIRRSIEHAPSAGVIHAQRGMDGTGTGTGTGTGRGRGRGRDGDGTGTGRGRDGDG